MGSNKKLLIQVDYIENDYKRSRYLLYEDGTYRCDHWVSNEVSRWEIRGDIFWYKHIDMPEFIHQVDSTLGKVIVDLLFERDVLGTNNE